jgi:hypothetical protein
MAFRSMTGMGIPILLDLMKKKMRKQETIIRELQIEKGTYKL